MSRQSEAVKTWRRRCKERIIEAMGGGCVVCGYNRCHASLDLHHIDPEHKDFGFGAIRANPKNWASLVVELRKCVLVCKNCHGEVHSGIAVVPQTAPRFNERFVDYKVIGKKDETSECPICLVLKPKQQKFCSSKCVGKSKYRVDWENIDLVDLLKTKSIVAVAEDLGCSDAAVHKRLKKLGLK